MATSSHLRKSNGFVLSEKHNWVLPIGLVVPLLGVVETGFCGLLCLLPRPIRALMVYLVLSLVLSQFGLSACWLALGRRWIFWRVIAAAGLTVAWASILTVAWASILSPIGLADLAIQWLAILLALVGLVLTGGLVARRLGFQLLELGAEGVPVATAEGGGPWQFSIKHLLLAMVVVAVFFAPGRPGLDLRWVLGEPTWLDVGCLTVTAVLTWVVVRSTLTVRRDRQPWVPLAAVVALGMWTAVLLAAFRKGPEQWLAAHLILAVFVLIVGFGVWLVELLPREDGDAQPVADNRTKPRQCWQNCLKHLLLLVLALAWLLGPLRDTLDPLDTSQLSVGVIWLPLAVSAALTLAIGWSTLTVERGWRYWTPWLAVLAPVVVLFCLWGPVALLFIPLFLLQTAWSFGTLVLLRRAGYRLCRLTPKGTSQ